MRFTIFSIVLLFMCFENVSKAQVVKVKPIAVMKRCEGFHKFPEVPGARLCGGGEIRREFHAQGCKNFVEKATKKKICGLSPLTQVQGEIDYTPSRDMKNLGLKIEVEVDGDDPVVVFDDPIMNGVVLKNIKYTLHITSVLDPMLTGKKLKCRYSIIDKEDDSLRLCVEIELLIV